VNYFELHIGDYESATAHLSILEDGVYNRLMRVYYRTQAPLPLDVKQICRLIRAVSKAERDTVALILSEFFIEGVDGWHNDRCDEEITRFKDKQAKARRSANARWDNSEGNADAMRTHSEGNAPRARPQAPDTSNQSFTQPSIPDPPPATASDRVGQFEGHATPVTTPNPAAGFAIALTRAGFACTALNPDLVEYVREGGTIEHVLQCAALPDCVGKKATYPIRIARRELADPARAMSPATPGRPPEPARNTDGPSPRLDPAVEAERKKDALAAMNAQLKELGIQP
jgi:uncharacterized protein YdaU (DUF1376 family)